MKALKTLFLTLVVSAVAVSLPAMAAEDIEDTFYTPKLSFPPGETVLEIPGADGPAYVWGNPVIPVYFNPEGHFWWEYGASNFGYMQLGSDEDRREYSIQLFESRTRQMIERINATQSKASLRYMGRSDADCNDMVVNYIYICYNPNLDRAGRMERTLLYYEDPLASQERPMSIGGVVWLLPGKTGNGLISMETMKDSDLLHEMLHAIGLPHLYLKNALEETIFSAVGIENLTALWETGRVEPTPLDVVTLKAVYPLPGPECAIPLELRDGLYRIRFNEVWNGAITQLSGEIAYTVVPRPIVSPEDGVTVVGYENAFAFVVTESKRNDVPVVSPCGVAFVDGEVEFPFIEAQLPADPEPMLYRLRIRLDYQIGGFIIIELEHLGTAAELKNSALVQIETLIQDEWGLFFILFIHTHSPPSEFTAHKCVTL